MYKKALEAMNEAGLDAMLISSPENIRYLSGFTGEGILLLCKDYRAVVTDFRYVISAEKECPGFEIIDKKEKECEILKYHLAKDTMRIGFESDKVTVARHKKWEKEMGSTEWVPVEEILADLRSIKSEKEIEAIIKAESIGDEVFERILKYIKSGITERQIALQLEIFMRELGADSISFDPIVASGVHSSMPHAVPTNKLLQEGDFLTLDFGCKVEGYCSDMTRTIVIGKASREQKELYHLVLRAQETVLHGIRPGMTGKEIDALARDIICNAGYGEMFGHGLGHSVGLEIHEEPRFSMREEKVILPGMVITVEPGIYCKGFGGVRIEDLVVITEDGCRNITNSTKELIELCW